MTAAEAPAAPALHFRIPAGSEAAGPPEARGLTRDGVRLLVAAPGVVRHRRFRDIAEFLAPGDLLVVNTSPTLPAAIDATLADGRPVVVHVHAELAAGHWIVELRRPDASGPERGVAPGTDVLLPGDRRLRLGAGYPVELDEAPRLRHATVRPAIEAATYLRSEGRPIGYGYLRGRFPVEAYQTVYADRLDRAHAGSAEMASAGRPFTAELIVRLIAAGVAVAPVVLHAGVSSPDAGEPPMPERFEVGTDTARLVNNTRDAGRRVVAVGTTVVRALESAADSTGHVRAAQGWTDLVLGPGRPARTVTGLVTGLHAPEASHLRLLEAVAGADLVRAAYEAAVRRRYLWHEFGDSTLFLP